MNDSKDIKELLERILEVQQAHLAAYQQQTKRALEVQDHAVSQQTKGLRIAKFAFSILVVFVVLFVLLIIANAGP